MIPPEPDPPGPGPDPPEPSYTYDYTFKVQNGMSQSYDFKLYFAGPSITTDIQSLAADQIGTFTYQSNTPIDYVRVVRSNSPQNFGILSGCSYYSYQGSPQHNSIVPAANGTYDVYVAGNEASNRFEVEE